VTPPPPEQTEVADAEPVFRGAPGGPGEARPEARSGGGIAPGEPPLEAAAASGASSDDEVALDALPVLAERPSGALARRTRRVLSRDLQGAAIPAVQAAAVAAGSFVAGAAVVGLVHRRSRGRAALAGGSRGGRSISPRKSSRGAEALQIVGTRTLLVDVHVLGTPTNER
jgi:hypothetical protein